MSRATLKLPPKAPRTQDSGARTRKPIRGGAPGARRGSTADASPPRGKPGAQTGAAGPAKPRKADASAARSGAAVRAPAPPRPASSPRPAAPSRPAAPPRPAPPRRPAAAPEPDTAAAAPHSRPRRRDSATEPARAASTPPPARTPPPTGPADGPARSGARSAAAKSRQPSTGAPQRRTPADQDAANAAPTRRAAKPPPPYWPGVSAPRPAASPAADRVPAPAGAAAVDADAVGAAGEAERPAAAPTAATAPAPAPATRAANKDWPRLSKRMSEMGICSRREADEWIENAWVRVDGEVVATLGARVPPQARIEVDAAARQHQSESVTFLLNKPVGYVSGQAEDGHEPASVLLRPENRWAEDGSPLRYKLGHLRGLAPAGRLDIDSTGLLVFTQDGRVARRLVGDGSGVEKEYLVRVEGTLADEGLQRLRHGLELDGVALKPAQVSWQNEEQLRVVLREGKKRQIRRMCELVGIKVVGLKRIRIGSVVLGKLPPGQWRYLRDDEKF